MLACRAAACRGRAALATRRGASLAAAAYAFPAGGRRSLALRLTPLGRRIVAAAHVRLMGDLRVTVRGGATVVRAVTVVVGAR